MTRVVSHVYLVDRSNRMDRGMADQNRAAQRQHFRWTAFHRDQSFAVRTCVDRTHEIALLGARFARDQRKWFTQRRRNPALGGQPVIRFARVPVGIQACWCFFGPGAECGADVVREVWASALSAG
jgi:hypothetical protein